MAARGRCTGTGGGANRTQSRRRTGCRVSSSRPHRPGVDCGRETLRCTMYCTVARASRNTAFVPDCEERCVQAATPRTAKATTDGLATRTRACLANVNRCTTRSSGIATGPESGTFPLWLPPAYACNTRSRRVEVAYLAPAPSLPPYLNHTLVVLSLCSSSSSDG